MRPVMSLLQEEDIKRIIRGGVELLEETGIVVHNKNALDIYKEGGAKVDYPSELVKIPSQMVEKALELAPGQIKLYDGDGNLAMDLQGYNVHYDPGSAAINILDYKTGEVRKPVTEDFIEFIKIVEQLDNYSAQSTALICSELPEEIADRYRLFLVLKYSKKPVITGTFGIDAFASMYEMLALVAGGKEALREKPRAIFDCCPSPPLMWSDVTSQNLIDCARAGIPYELISMPLAGGTSPATLAGALVQHTAESLSGVVLGQLASPGAKVMYGGSPSIFDMRKGTTPMGAIETMMIDSAYNQIGKHLGLPTHAYMGLTDSKIADSQSGAEGAMGIVLAALAGVNVVSGPGMMDFESCQSIEKLILDNELCGMAKRLLRGIDTSDEALAVNVIKEVGHEGKFLTHRHTMKWFSKSQYIPSPVIDRGTRREWADLGKKTCSERAKDRIPEILKSYKGKPLSVEVEKKLDEIMKNQKGFSENLLKLSEK